MWLSCRQHLGGHFVVACPPTGFYYGGEQASIFSRRESMCIIRSRFLLFLAAVGVLGAILPLPAADPKELDALLKKQVELKKADRIVFLGDSLTFLGGKEEPKQHVTKGFVRIVRETLKEKHPDKNIDWDWVSTGGGTVQT